MPTTERYSWVVNRKIVIIHSAAQQKRKPYVLSYPLYSMINVLFHKPSGGERSAHQLSIWGGRNHACVICIWPPLCPQEAQGLAEQEPGLTAKNRLKQHHSKLSSVQSPWGNQATVPSRVLKVGERSPQDTEPFCGGTGGWGHTPQGSASGLFAPQKGPSLDSVPPRS